eukprot:Sspe_Gene.31405::Locus_15502_Transcript_1_1_Confidence_1.000_Length_2188::g.31405::m.31405
MKARKDEKADRKTSEQMEEELTVTLGKLEATENQLKETTAQYEAAKSQLEEATVEHTAKVTELEDRLRNQADEITRLTKEVENATEASAGSVQAKDDEIAALRKELDSLHETNDKAQEEVTALLKEKKQLNDELAVMQQQFTELEKETEENKAGLVESTTGALEEAAKLMNDLKDVRSQLAKKEKKLEAVKKELSTAKGSIEKLGEDKADLEARLTVCQTELNALTSKKDAPRLSVRPSTGRRSVKRVHEEDHDITFSENIARSRYIMEFDDEMLVKPGEGFHEVETPRCMAEPGLARISIASASTVDVPVDLDGTPYQPPVKCIPATDE